MDYLFLRRHRRTATSNRQKSLLLKAAELGLDTLVMGIRDGEALRELLNIPDSENVVSVIAVGYRGQEPPERPKRKELEVVAKFI